MSTYTETIFTGFIIFAFLSVFFLFITWAIQYRRNGFFYLKEGVIFLSFILFIEIAYFMVILPLPDIETFPTSSEPLLTYMQLVPFYFIQEIFDYFSSHEFNIIAFIKFPVVYMTLFNILLLYPLGVFLKNLFNYSLKKIVIIGFLVSLSFELIQLSGLLFIYPHPYRLFDVDDLTMNTLGSFLGGLTASIYYPMFKKSQKSKYKIENFQPSSFKQLFIIISDIFIIIVFATVIVIIKNILKISIDFNIDKIIYFTISVVYFCFAIVDKQFQTLSMKFMRFKLVNDNDSIVKRIIHIGILYSPFLFFGEFNYTPIIKYIILGGCFVISVYVIISILLRKRSVNIVDKKLGYSLIWNTNPDSSFSFSTIQTKESIKLSK